MTGLDLLKKLQSMHPATLDKEFDVIVKDSPIFIQNNKAQQLSHKLLSIRGTSIIVD